MVMLLIKKKSLKLFQHYQIKETMKSTILSLLRDKNTTTEGFRKAADQLGSLLSFEVAGALEKVEGIIETPLAKTKGYHFKQNIILVPILRAGIALLYPFMKLFPNCKVGFVGIRRDETTALPELYYQNLPLITASDIVVVIDPMIATGGSGGLVVKMLKELGLTDDRIIYAGIIAAPEGLESLQNIAPGMKIISTEVDERLNDQKFIMPGLGDFGDRYFGT